MSQPLRSEAGSSQYVIQAKATIGGTAGKLPSCTLTLSAEGLELRRSKFAAGLMGAPTELIDGSKSVTLYKTKTRLPSGGNHILVMDGSRYSVVALRNAQASVFRETAAAFGFSTRVVEVPTKTALNVALLVAHLERTGELPSGSIPV